MQKHYHKDNFLKIIPLGGCEEVGRNMTVFEYNQDIIILDMGIQFPEEDMPGVDYVIPNTEYLKGRERNIKGVIFSHGHLDHIGAAPILLRKLGNPLIIGRPLTIEMIKHRVEDFEKGGSKFLKTIYVKDVSDRIRLGSFNIGFFPVDHAIIDAVGVIINTPPATVVHPGDWMIKHSPEQGKEIKYTQLSKLPRPTVMMLESLGSTNSREPVTEKTMLNNLYKLISEAPGRTIIATFSSQIQRIGQVMEYSSKIGKKIALDGFSMKLNVEIAKQLGYIKEKKGSLISMDRISSYPENKIVVICTGAQGEEMSVLTRIVSGNHRFIKIKKSDTVIFSSSVVPGNERTIQRLKDNIYRLSDNVYHSDIMDVHISGHSNIRDIEEIIRQVSPTYLIPVYANYYFLKETERIAKRIGFPPNKILVPDNGMVIRVNAKTIEADKNKVPSNYVFVDGLGVGDVGEIVLRDRQMLARDGMFVVIAIIDRKTGKVIGSPDIISRGFVYLKESKDLLRQTRKKVISIVGKAAGSEGTVNWIYIKEELREKIGDFLYQQTQRRPMVLPVVIEV